MLICIDTRLSGSVTSPITSSMIHSAMCLLFLSSQITHIDSCSPFSGLYLHPPLSPCPSHLAATQSQATFSQLRLMAAEGSTRLNRKE